jgi:hypothetical protein
MKRNTLALAILSCASTIVAAQAQQQVPPTQSVPANDSKVRIYVSDSTSWEASGSWGTSNGSGGGSSKAGARPQTAEIIKTFNERCPQFTITSNKDKANFAVILDHEGGKGALQRRNKIAVFNRDGDVIFSDSTRSLGNSVKDACAAIDKDSSKK